MAHWNLDHVVGEVIAPDAASTLHDPDRVARDAALGDRLELTAEEIENGCLLPVWPRVKHLACGTVVSLAHIAAARAFAQDPRRPIRAAKGLPCEHASHQRPIDEAGNDSTPLFPIQGDLRGRPGEWEWVDWHRRETGILVGDNPSGRAVVHPGQTFGQFASEGMAKLTGSTVDMTALMPKES